MRKSLLIPGVAALVMLATPIAVAPWRLDESLDFVRRVERRPPASWPSVRSSGQVVSGETWAAVAAAIRDRIPFRGALVGLKRDIEIGVLGERMAGSVAVGRDGWLFFAPELGELAGTPEQMAEALATAHSFGARRTGGARLILVPAPDKSSLYPDQLIGGPRQLFDAAEQSRDLARSWFRGAGPPERVDTWSLFKAAQSTVDVPLYEVTGSHHSSFGSMVLAKAMVEAVAPGAWDASEVRQTEVLVYQSDLSRTAGYLGRVEEWERYEVVRPGVELVRYIEDGEPVEGRDRPLRTELGQKAVLPARYINRSTGAQLIPGRTLIVHDSFVASYLRPTLRQFFEDVTFVHYKDLSGPDFQEALEDFDIVYLQCVERSVRHLFNKLFRPCTLPGEHRVLELSDRGLP